MALPSQHSRGGGRVPRLTGGRRRKKRRRLVVLGLLVGVVIVVGWRIIVHDPSTPPSKAIASLDAPAEAQRANGQPSDPPRRSALEARNTSRLARGSGGAQDTTVPDPEITDTVVDVRHDETRPSENRTRAETIVEPSAMDPTPPRGASARNAAAIDHAQTLLDQNRPIEARDVLNRALFQPGASARERGELRARLAAISDLVTYSPRVFGDDPMADIYVVQPGDALTAIPRKGGFRVEYGLIQRINRIANPNQIRVGQRLKGLYGPFHIVVHKAAFRLDVFADQRDSAGDRLYIRSFPVGLGEYGSTPTGRWKVASGRKLTNPAWANPRTGQRFTADDPENPIGERWIALEGVDEETQLLTGYGIHGTVAPASIGREESMGCVRMLPDDVSLLYDMLVGGLSEVEIVD